MAAQICGFCNRVCPSLGAEPVAAARHLLPGRDQARQLVPRLAPVTSLRVPDRKKACCSPQNGRPSLFSSSCCADLDDAQREKVVGAKRRGEAILRNSGLGYTIVRPGPLVEEAGGYKALVFDQARAQCVFARLTAASDTSWQLTAPG